MRPEGGGSGGCFLALIKNQYWKGRQPERGQKGYKCECGCQVKAFPTQIKENRRIKKMKKYSDIKLVGITALAATLIIIFGFSLCLAVTGRPRAVRLDPFGGILIEGADGYAKAYAQFDRDAFEKKMQEMISSDPNMFGRFTSGKKKAAELAGMVADSVVSEMEIQKGERASENGQTAAGSGIFNQDTVSVNFYVSDKAQDILRENGLYYVFECTAIRQTAKGLPEAKPYDPFTELSVSFSGIDGSGEVSLDYEGDCPLQFDVEPASGLHNGDPVHISVSFSDGFDDDSFAGKYHLMLVTAEKTFYVKGLLISPKSPEDFTGTDLVSLRQQLQDAASGFIEDEYEDDERLVSLSEEGLVFLNSESSNALIALYLVNFANEAGEELEYHYYVRVDDILLRGEGDAVVDLSKAAHPQKPSFLFGEFFGQGEEVSVPGFLGLPGFRTLAGFESSEQMRRRIIVPLKEHGDVYELE